MRARWLRVGYVPQSVTPIGGVHDSRGAAVKHSISCCPFGAEVGTFIILPGNDGPFSVAECVHGRCHEEFKRKGRLGARKEARAAAESDDRGVVAPYSALLGRAGRVPLGDVLKDDAREAGTPSFGKYLGGRVEELNGKPR